MAVNNKYLDESGLQILWNKTKDRINSAVANKADKSALNAKANTTDVYNKSDLTFVLNGTTLTITKK